MEELLKNIDEFLESGEENLKKERFIAAVSELFDTYVKSYNLRLGKEEAIKLKEYAYELKECIANKK